MSGTIADLIIRPATNEDVVAIHALSRRVFAAYSESPARLVGSMLEEDGALTAVAELGGSVVGFVVIAFNEYKREFGPWKRPVIGRLNAIAVHPDSHEQGIGGRLLRSAEEAAEARGAVSITLNTATTNRRALRLFKNAGYLGFLTTVSTYARGQNAIAMFKALY